MKQAKNGDTVKLHYTIKLQNGRVFATTKEDQPLELRIGSGRFVPGIEQGIIGMETGEEKSMTLPPEDAYGLRREELVVDVNKSKFPDNITPGIGKQLQVLQPDGTVIDVIIKKIAEDTVTLDANHPLAGETLTFDIELVEVT